MSSRLAYENSNLMSGLLTHLHDVVRASSLIILHLLSKGQLSLPTLTSLSYKTVNCSL